MDLVAKIDGIASEMLDEKSTCKKCDFKVCPMLGLFAARFKSVLQEASAGGKEDGCTGRPADTYVYDRLARLSGALTKIIEMTKDHSQSLDTRGFVYRVAHNALAFNSVNMG